MKNSWTFNLLPEKMKDWLARIEWQLGLALMVIACYLRLITLEEGSKSSSFWVKLFYFILYGIAILINYLSIYSKFFWILYKESFSVLILKEKPWLTVNERIS